MPEQLTDADILNIRQLAKDVPELAKRTQAAVEAEKKWGNVNDAVAGVTKGLEQQLEARKAELATLEKRLNGRLDELMTRANRPGNMSERTEEDKRALRAFDKFLRKGERSLNDEDMKALEGDDPSAGGFLIPHPLRGPIIQELILTSPIRQAAAPITITQGDTWEDPEDTGTIATGWVGERASRPATATQTFNLRKTPLREVYAYPQATQRLIDDVGFDLGGYISQKIGAYFGKTEGTGFVHGSTPTEPQGILQNSEVDATTASGAAATVTADGVLNLFAALQTPDAVGISLFCNRKSAFALRKLKDNQNRYLWEPGLPAGARPGLQGDSLASVAATFAGVPIVETPDLVDLSAGSKSFFVGNLRESYRIVDKMDVRIQVDPYTNKPYVGWYATKRVGGSVIKPRGIKIMTTGA